MNKMHTHIAVKMNFKCYIDKGFITPVTADKEEIAKLIKLAERDILAAQDCHEPDWQFAIAYNAASQLASCVLRASGYQSTMKAGHHWPTITIFPELMDREFNETRDYFNACRFKRNIARYNEAGTITQLEAEKLIQEVKAFKKKVISWLRQHHPKLINPEK